MIKTSSKTSSLAIVRGMVCSAGIVFLTNGASTTWATVTQLSSIPSDALLYGQYTVDSQLTGTFKSGVVSDPGADDIQGISGSSSQIRTGTFTFSYSGAGHSAEAVKAGKGGNLGSFAASPASGFLDTYASSHLLALQKDLYLKIDAPPGTATLSSLRIDYYNDGIGQMVDLAPGLSFSASNDQNKFWEISTDWLSGGFTLTAEYVFTGNPDKGLFVFYTATPEPATACFGGALVLGLGAMELRRRRNKA